MPCFIKVHCCKENGALVEMEPTFLNLDLVVDFNQTRDLAATHIFTTGSADAYIAIKETPKEIFELMICSKRELGLGK